jgi:hypothetical protein
MLFDGVRLRVLQQSGCGQTCIRQRFSDLSGRAQVAASGPSERIQRVSDALSLTIRIRRTNRSAGTEMGDLVQGSFSAMLAG